MFFFLFFMQYFKNSDLTKTYPISEKAIRNWIASAKDHKLDLELHEDDGKHYIADTSKNAAIIERLVNERKKYVNSKARKTVKPRDVFYEIYNQDQIFDIITNIETYGEVPLKYSYFNEGAEYWDRYSQKLASEDTPNILNRTVDLLDVNAKYLMSLIQGYSKINVVDIGPGNGQPAQSFVKRLIDDKRLNRYIAIDISQSMLDKVEQNMQSWFGDNFPYEGYARDVTHDRFRDVLGEDAVGPESDSVCNLVLLLGCTFANFRAPSDALRLVHSSLGPNDLLAYSLMLDSETSKRYFDFNVSTPAIPQDSETRVPYRSFLTIDHLNIDPSMYEFELFFDNEKKCRIGQIRLKIALTIEFEFNNFSRSIALNKGDTLIIWRNKHQTATEMLDQLQDCGFNPLQVSQSSDHEYIFAISEVKTDK